MQMIGANNRRRQTTTTRHILLAFAALAASTFAPAARAAEDELSAPAMERMQHWADDHAAMLDAKLAGLRAGQADFGSREALAAI